MQFEAVAGNAGEDKNSLRNKLKPVKDFLEMGWAAFSQKTPEQIEMLRNPASEYYVGLFEAAAGPLEKAAGSAIRNVVRMGQETPHEYERFVPHVEYFTDEPILTLVYGSLDDPATIDSPPDARQSLLFRALQLPQGGDMYPKQGIRCVFRGPASRAAHSKKQLIEASERICEATMPIVEKFLDKHRGRAHINDFSFSTGTHDGMNVAKRIAERGFPIKKMTLVSPGLSIGKGIFAAWPAQPAADSLRAKGYTPASFHEAIYEYTQEANLEGLPRDTEIEVHYGTHDTIIPAFQPGGSVDFLRLAREKGFKPVEVRYEGYDHVTMPGKIIWENALGNDPFCLRSPRKVFEYKA